MKNKSDFADEKFERYDSRIIDEKLRACPHLPTSRTQKEVFGIYKDNLGNTQASYMSNYELICRVQLLVFILFLF